MWEHLQFLLTCVCVCEYAQTCKHTLARTHIHTLSSTPTERARERVKDINTLLRGTLETVIKEEEKEEEEEEEDVDGLNTLSVSRCYER